jgi:hypothetical protein
MSKPKRIVSPKTLDEVRNVLCMGCASLDPAAAREAAFDHGIRSHPHHLISKGAGGPDIIQNLLPVCVPHHQEIHRIGLAAMASKYGCIAHWLRLAGWEWDGSQGKWLPNFQTQ